MKTIAFFNNKGGVGKTTLVYHLSWMYANMGHNVVAADLDPQSNLTSMFLNEERLEDLWPDGEHCNTILGAIDPILKGTGDVKNPYIEKISKEQSFFSGDLSLVVGDLGLSKFEDDLSDHWPKCMDRKENAFRIISAFYRLLKMAAEKTNSELVLIDVGPNLGAINRAALIAADYIVIPLAPDLFSLQGLRNLGPTLRRWREEWKERLQKKPMPDLPLPEGLMEPAGYIILQHATRVDRPVQAYAKWIARIPGEYRLSVLGEKKKKIPTFDNDPHCLALLKHYRSLMPMAMEARKPIFFLKPADGVIGAHVKAVRSCHDEFETLAGKILDHCGINQLTSEHHYG